MSVIKAVDVKVFATKGGDINPYEFVGVLQRWIRDHVVPGILIDVADYSHIPNGPGVILVGHEANISVDYADGRMGLVYRYRWPSEADSAGRVAGAIKAALDAASKLEKEPEFKGRLQFNLKSVEVISNDRLTAGNSDAAAAAFSATVAQGIGSVLSGVKVARKTGDSRERLAVTVG